MSLTAQSSYVRRRDDVRLRGKVKGAGAGRVVVIWQKNVGKRRWVLEAQKTTNGRGVFRHREDVKSGDRWYRACSRGKCSKNLLIHMGKPPREPKKPTSLAVVSVAPLSIEAGQSVTVSGTASANLAGQTVFLQSYDAGTSSWGSVGSAQVNGAGSWSGTATLTRAGKAVPVRVVFNGSPTLLPSSVGAASVAVYGWYYLYDGPPTEVARSYDEDYGPYKVNGVTYSKSLALFGSTGYTSYVEYDLGRSCLRLDAVVGLQDESSTVTRANGRILADSVQKWNQAEIALGQQFPVSVDLSNALRLRIENIETTSGSGGLVFGDARALCAF